MRFKLNPLNSSGVSVDDVTVVQGGGTSSSSSGAVTSVNSRTGDVVITETDVLPSQTGNNGKYLTTDGSASSWATLAGGGDMSAATYDPATVSEQLVGLTATQTLTNKTLTTPTLTLKQSTTPTPTAEGDIQWDTDGNQIAIGDGTGTKVFSDDSVVLNADNHTSGTTNKVYTATEQTKLAGIATGATANSSDATLLNRANHTGTQTAATISDFDTEVANNAAVTANTAKVTNATHTGEVTGSGALTIADDVVDEANLKVDNSPTDDYYLAAKASATGGLTWKALPAGGTGTVTSVAATVPTGFTVSGSPITTTGTLGIGYDTGYQGYTTAEASKLSGVATGAIANVVEDTTPELGGQLDTGGNNITTGGLALTINTGGAGLTLAGTDFVDISSGNQLLVDNIQETTLGSGVTVDGVLLKDGLVDGVDVSAEQVRLANTSGTNTGDQTTITGNAGTATTLQTSRTFRTNLASTSTASFNGSANVTPGVTGTLAVGNGGTGRATSTTAYGLIAAGTTATGAHQTLATGTSGQILKSNGSAALPTFQTGTGADVGLGNVDNTSDATKNSATATLTNKTIDASQLVANSIDNTKIGTSAILLGFAEVTSITGTSATSATAISGLTSTVTVPSGGRSVEITVEVGDVRNGTVNSIQYLSLWNGTVGSGTKLQEKPTTMGIASQRLSNSFTFIHTPTAGSITYNVGHHVSAGTNAYSRASGSPAQIIVKLL